MGMELHEVVIFAALLVIMQVIGIIGNVAVFKTTAIREQIKYAAIMAVAEAILAGVTISLVLSWDW